MSCALLSSGCGFDRVDLQNRRPRVRSLLPLPQKVRKSLGNPRVCGLVLFVGKMYKVLQFPDLYGYLPTIPCFSDE